MILMQLLALSTHSCVWAFQASAGWCFQPGAGPNGLQRPLLSKLLCDPPCLSDIPNIVGNHKTKFFPVSELRSFTVLSYLPVVGLVGNHWSSEPEPAAFEGAELGFRFSLTKRESNSQTESLGLLITRENLIYLYLPVDTSSVDQNIQLYFQCQ